MQVTDRKSTNWMIAIPPNRPSSNAVSESVSAFSAAMMPSPIPKPRIGAIEKYWKARAVRSLGGLPPIRYAMPQSATTSTFD